MSPRNIVVGFSGGVTSAWCAGWALRTFPSEQVLLLWHDTKAEHEDTYRFLREMAAKLEKPIVEVSDGRSPTELFRDEGFLGNNQNAMCSRVLKREPGDRFVNGLRGQGIEVVLVFGFSAREPDRVHRAVGRAAAMGCTARFPIVEENVTKQQCADWCADMGVKPSSMYCWAEHANCVGCVKGGKAYWLAVKEHAPETFEHFARLEEEFGHNIIRGGDKNGVKREHVTLRQLAAQGLKRKVSQKEAIEIGACDCGD